MTIDHDAIAARVRHSRDTGGPYAWQPDLSAAYLDLYDEVKRLRAERDRLRAALTNALDACRIVDAAAKEGHDRIGDLVLHMLSAVEPARAALKGDTK